MAELKNDSSMPERKSHTPYFTFGDQAQALQIAR
jgi:hypothetical protein